MNYRWLEEAGIPHSVVLTKTDSQSRPGIVRAANEACMRFQSIAFGESEYDDDDAVYLSPVVHATSAKRDTGINELLWFIDRDFDQDDEDYDEEEVEEGAKRREEFGSRHRKRHKHEKEEEVAGDLTGYGYDDLASKKW